MTGDQFEIDTSVAHVARVYDFLLGGTTNFEVDRAMAEQVTKAQGGIDASRARIQANRRFLGRVVRFLAGEAGIRQFLDLGTGIPTEENVHQVAQQVAPDARIVYVDNDPVVLAHAHQLLDSTSEGATAYLDADVRDPDDIVARAAETLDFSQPVAVMLISMMHLFGADEDPWGLVGKFVGAVPSGSYLAMSHLTSESDQISQVAKAVTDNPNMRYRLQPRSHDDISRFFAGLELIEPGVVRINNWRPDDTDETAGAEVPFYGGVARKP